MLLEIKKGTLKSPLSNYVSPFLASLRDCLWIVLELKERYRPSSGTVLSTLDFLLFYGHQQEAYHK